MVINWERVPTSHGINSQGGGGYHSKNSQGGGYHCNKFEGVTMVTVAKRGGYHGNNSHIGKWLPW